MKNSLFAAIYYTSGMSPPSKIATFWLTFGTFFAPFSRVPRKTLKKHLREACFKKSYHFRPTLWGGGVGEVPFPVLFTHLGPFGPTWSQGASGTPPNLHFWRFWERKYNLFTIFGANIFEILAETGDSFSLPKLNKKNGERSALYFLLWGKPFGRQSTSHSLLLQNSTKKNGGRSALYFLLWGEPFGRQSTGLGLHIKKDVAPTRDKQQKQNSTKNKEQWTTNKEQKTQWARWRGCEAIGYTHHIHICYIFVYIYIYVIYIYMIYIYTYKYCIQIVYIYIYI